MAESKEKQPKSDLAVREEQILDFWQKNKIFEKSLEKESPKGNYVFYDGPPFATGLPHYGHILGSTAKDVIGRYKTMQGYHVPRRWGWDCHGLPIENIVEKDLGVSGHKEIEALGIEKFVEHARSKVLTYVHEWKKTVDRIGRWVDFDGGYKTMDNTFIESVWWALSELDKKGLVYEGVRVLAYCPRCETPIANSEIAMDNSYKEITDISVYAKFELKDEPKTYLVAWTTTPWTLPGNVALAVNPNFIYAKIEIDGATYIIAEDRLSVVKAPYKELGTISGSDLIGKKYIPVFDYYMHDKKIAGPKTWTIVAGDFVTLDAGTGIVHIAPAFGEDDMALAKREGLPWIIHVTPMGQFKDEITHFAGQFVKPKGNHQAADIEIIKYLAHNHKLFEKQKIIHSYPHCYRCETPLYYYALPSWFVNIQKVKPAILDKAKSINWIPEHLKNGRFKASMESAPDWTISRNRYWASPLPIWKSASGKMMFLGSIEELKKNTKKSGNNYIVMRHGQAENNVSGLMSTRPDNPHHLTALGRRQVEASAEELKDKKIDLIFSSPFIRTRETAEIVREKINLPKDSILIDDRLHEVNVGMFEGKKVKEYHNFFKNDSDKFSLKPDGGENYQDIKNRMGEFLYDIEKKHQNKNILIITHDLPGWLMLAAASGLDVKAAAKFRGTKALFFGNAEFKKFDFVPLPHNRNYELDLHRPYIDEIKLADEEGEEYTRIPEVVDCWFESGSMPFAQDHYPFERPNWKKDNFPAGFVAEYIAQTRTWFYYTHVISAVLFGSAPFRNVVTTGTLLATDGAKMSKSKGNFPDPAILFDKYGVDALRFYLMASPLMKGEDINFLEDKVDEIYKKIFLRFQNVCSFYELYRDKSLEEGLYDEKPANVLDKWIIARFNEVVREVTEGMEAYDMLAASQPFNQFVDDLSTWYLRRSRDRIKDEASQPASAEGSGEARRTLYFILKSTAKLLAPLAPFMAEDIWTKLRVEKNKESIHLTNWPEVKKSFNLFGLIKSADVKILKNMENTRKIVSLGLEARQKAGFKVRQPLQKLTADIAPLGDEYIELIKDELNVKEVIFSALGQDREVALDTNLTPELKAEGQYRELVRAIQDLRKSSDMTPSDKISLSLDTDKAGQALVKKFEADLKKSVVAKKIEFKANDGVEIKIEELSFKIKISK